MDVLVAIPDEREALGIATAIEQLDFQVIDIVTEPEAVRGAILDLKPGLLVLDGELRRSAGFAQGRTPTLLVKKPTDLLEDSDETIAIRPIDGDALRHQLARAVLLCPISRALPLPRGTSISPAPPTARLRRLWAH